MVLAEAFAKIRVPEAVTPKRVKFALALLSVAGSLLTANPAVAQSSCVVVSNRGNVNVRNNPSTEADIIGVINVNAGANSQGEIFPDQQDPAKSWYKVDLAGNIGYTRTDVSNYDCSGNVGVASTSARAERNPSVITINVPVIPIEQSKNPDGSYITIPHNDGEPWVNVFNVANRAGAMIPVYAAGTLYGDDGSIYGTGSSILRMQPDRQVIFNGRDCTVKQDVSGWDGNNFSEFIAAVSQTEFPSGMAVVTSANERGNLKLGRILQCNNQ